MKGDLMVVFVCKSCRAELVDWTCPRCGCVAQPPGTKQG